MKPKKKQIDNVIIYGILLMIVIYLSFHSAICYAEVKNNSPWLIPFLQALGERINAEPFQFEANELTTQFLAWSCFGWFLAVAAIENSKKNYIHGKEFGTSKWATKREIKDLFSETILAKELKQLKRVKRCWGRILLERQLYKKQKRIKRLAVQHRLKDLKKDSKKKMIRKEEYKEKKKQIYKEEKKQMLDALGKEWEPFLWRTELFEARRKTKDHKAWKKDYKEYSKRKKDFYKTYYKKREKQLKAKFTNSDIILSKTEKVCIYNRVINMNMILLGGSGAGKTRSYMLSNILQLASAGISSVITDPKGEILEKVGYYLEHIMHYKIRVLNLDNMEESDCLNPFHYIHPERPGYEENILNLVETIIINTNSEEAKTNCGDPFWDKAEKMFLQSVFFLVSDGFCDEERNIDTLLKLIAMLKLEEEDDTKDSDLDYFVEIFAKKFGEEHIGVQIYREFREKASGKMAQSIVMSALVRLTPFRTPAVRKIMSKDDMELDRIGEEKMAVFVIVPPTNSTFNFIAGILFTLLFQEIQYCATQVHKHEGQQLPVRCQFFLDEHANTCKIPRIEKITAYGRSFGIGITFGIQSLEQLKHMYKDSWGTLMDNCSTLLFLGSISHLDTLKYMSELLAKSTFDKKTTGRTRGRQGSSSRNEDVVGRELMDVSDLRKLEKKNCIIVISGRNPFYSEKYDYTSHEAYIFTSDANKANTYYYIPIRKKSPHREEKRGTKQVSSQTEIKMEPIRISLSENKLIEIANNFQDYQPLSDSVLFEDPEDQESFYNFVKNEMEVENKEQINVRNIIKASKETIQYVEQQQRNEVVVKINQMKDIERIQEIHEEMETISDEELDAEYEEYPTEIENEVNNEFLRQLNDMETVLDFE